MLRGAFPLILVSALASACSDAPSDPHDEQPDAGPADDAGPDDAGSDAALGPVPMVGADYASFDALSVSDAGVLELSFPLPADARSFVITASADQRGYLLLLDLQHADGRVLFDRKTKDAGPFRPALSENLELWAPLSVLYPSAPSDSALGAGRYRVRLGFVPESGGGAAANLRVDVVWQTRSAPTSLPLNIWLARGSSETAESLIANSLYLDAFDRLRTIFEPVGVALEPLQAFDLGAEGSDLSQIESDDDLVDLLAALEQEPAGGLDVILVDRIVTTGKTVRGKSTGIPGPPAHPALTRRGAVVLSLEDLPRDPLRIAEAMAHEATHYLGLRHTTELDAAEHDPLADTPECPIALASYKTTSGDLLLSPADCADYDGTNLQFPMPPFDDKPQHDLTPDQISVLRGSPLLR
ncbi:MAG: hypothetical protein QM778_20210 [Myxococcales bacterium]